MVLCAVWGCPNRSEAIWSTGDTAAELREWAVCLRHSQDLLAGAPCTIRSNGPTSSGRWLVISDDRRSTNYAWPELAEEIENYAEMRGGDYDVRAIVEDIEARFGPSSLRELPDDQIDQLFQAHRIEEDRR